MTHEIMDAAPQPRSARPAYLAGIRTDESRRFAFPRGAPFRRASHSGHACGACDEAACIDFADDALVVPLRVQFRLAVPVAGWLPDSRLTACETYAHASTRVRASVGAGALRVNLDGRRARAVAAMGGVRAVSLWHAGGAGSVCVPDRFAQAGWSREAACPSREARNGCAIVCANLRRFRPISAFSTHYAPDFPRSVTPAPPADCLPDAAPAADNAAPLAQAITLAMGIGCRQGVSVAQIEAAVQAALGAWPLAHVRAVATLDAKTAEPALRAFCAAHGLPLQGFTREQVQATARQAASASDSMQDCAQDSAPSAAALARFGVPGVCEPCARLAAGGGALLRGKLALDGVTVALAAIAPDTRR